MLAQKIELDPAQRVGQENIVPLVVALPRNDRVIRGIPWSGPGGTPGPTEQSLDGWIDGKAASGRVIVNGRADGVWTAAREE